MNVIFENGGIQEWAHHPFHFRNGFMCDVQYELTIVETICEIIDDYTIIYHDHSERRTNIKEILRLRLDNLNVSGSKTSLFHHRGRVVFRQVNDLYTYSVEGEERFVNRIHKIVKFIKTSGINYEKIEQLTEQHLQIVLPDDFLNNYVEKFRKSTLALDPHENQQQQLNI